MRERKCFLVNYVERSEFMVRIGIHLLFLDIIFYKQASNEFARCMCDAKY